ncbi:unnamed protein product [Mytilus edulis]|uniref:Uncharacterized protein n=1 Tax=Mytilus edulis TaxID=6550 RepID=A0A8S3SIR0_MYTED|nr:unnamed protein product [Mytilus edulis]
MVSPFKNNIIACTEEGEQVQACTIFKRVYGIAVIPHTEEAVISLADVKIIQFVNIVSLVPGRQIKVVIEDNSIYGIAVVRDSIIVGGSCGNVHFIEKMKGKCLKTIKIGPGAIRSIVPFISAKDDVIYCCEHSGNKKVHRLKLDGSLISNCELENPIGMTLDSKSNVYVESYDFGELYNPLGITLDSKGNIYITCYDSHCLHRLSSDCKIDDIMLKKADGIDRPMSVAFNKTFSKLYISNSGSDRSVLIFNCK